MHYSGNAICNETTKDWETLLLNKNILSMVIIEYNIVRFLQVSITGYVCFEKVCCQTVCVRLKIQYCKNDSRGLHKNTNRYAYYEKNRAHQIYNNNSRQILLSTSYGKIAKISISQDNDFLAKLYFGTDYKDP